jgi:hypothetical protein
VRAAAGQPGAQRGEGVVGEVPGPDEVPDDVGQRRVVGGAHQVGESAEEQGLAGGQQVEHRRAHGVGLGALQWLGQQHVGEVGRHEGDPAVAAGQAARTGPQHLAGAGELVEHRGGVVADPRRQHQGLQRRRRHEGTGQLLDDGEHAVGAAQPAADRLPGRREPGQGADGHRFDLLAQLREAATADGAQHVGVAPLLAGAAGPELPGDQSAGADQPLQRRGHHGYPEP